MGEETETVSKRDRKGVSFFANRIISVKAVRKIDMSITTNLQSAP